MIDTMPAVAYRKILGGALAATIAFTLAACAPERVPMPTPTVTETSDPPLPAPVQKEKSFFDKTQYSIDDPLSIWVINDKLRPLNPIDYVPLDMVYANVHYISEPLMRPEAAAAIVPMFAASEADRKSVV